MEPILASTILQWVLILALIIVCLVILAELGRLKANMPQFVVNPAAAQLVESNGPELGTVLPSPDRFPFHGPEVEKFFSRASRSERLCLFLSVHCESCHDLVDGINYLTERANMPDVMVIMRGTEKDIETFLSVFKLRCCVLPDIVGTIALEVFEVRRAPFALLYGTNGELKKRELLVGGKKSLESLIGKENQLSNRSTSAVGVSV